MCLALQLNSSREAYLRILPLDRLLLFVGVEDGSLTLGLNGPDGVRIDGLPTFLDRLEVSFGVVDIVERSCISERPDYLFDQKK